MTETVVVKYEARIPKDLYERFNELRPMKKLILMEYFNLHEETPTSPNQLVPKIARKWGYKINSNKSNSHILDVIQRFIS